MDKRENQKSTELHELGYFIRVANDSCNEALRKLDASVSYLAAVDLLYMDFVEAAGSIVPASATVLLVNAHASWRAGIRLALSGQLLPVFMTLRGSIESALYANAMVIAPELERVWLERNKDQDATDACRQAFTAKKMFRYLEQAHEKGFSDSLRDVYEATIDFGAHPNSHSVIRSIQIEQLDVGKHTLDFAYIHGADSFELRQSLVACAEVGIAVFFVVLLCFDKHPRLSELNERALVLQAQVPAFIKGLELKGPEDVGRKS